MTTQLPKIEHIYSGKVRDIYTYGDDYLLFRTSNRISAFDVILPDEIPGKGRVLNELTEFWCEKYARIVPNHLTHITPPEMLPFEETGQLMVVKKLQPLPVEAIVRGYIIGSGWKDYQKTGAVCGHKLPQSLQLADQLPEPIYTPSTKAAVGDHDINITFEETKDIIGVTLAYDIQDIALELYKEAASYAAQRGIIIADTKFEFGTDKDGKIYLMDEALTPDSSRFWPRAEWQPGNNPPSYDKQIVRDYLETLDWDKKDPGPRLPENVILDTAAKYKEIQHLLTS